MLEHPKVPNERWRHLLAQMKEVQQHLNQSTPLVDISSDVGTLDFRSSTGDLYRALFNAADRIKEYTYSFGMLEEANRLDEESYPGYDHAESIQRLASIMKVFQIDHTIDGIGHNSDVPVFIVGMLRSGTSIFEQYLTSHSRIVSLGEDSIFNGQLPEVINDISIVMKTSKTVEVVAEILDRRAGDILRRMQERAELIRKEQGIDSKDSIRYIVDKMVFNFRNIGLIQLLFPYATIIHVIRDPMDTLLSCYSKRFESPSKLEIILSH